VLRTCVVLFCFNVQYFSSSIFYSLVFSIFRRSIFVFLVQFTFTCSYLVVLSYVQ
jgi:hypothetical protein